MSTARKQPDGGGTGIEMPVKIVAEIWGGRWDGLQLPLSSAEPPQTLRYVSTQLDAMAENVPLIPTVHVELVRVGTPPRVDLKAKITKVLYRENV